MTGHGRPRVTFYFITSSISADMTDDDSPAKVSLAASQVGTLRMAALLYGLDSATSGVQHS